MFAVHMAVTLGVEDPKVAQSCNGHEPGLEHSAEQVNTLDLLLMQVVVQVSIGHSQQALLKEAQESTWKTAVELLVELASCSSLQAQMVAQGTWVVARVDGKEPEHCLSLGEPRYEDSTKKTFVLLEETAAVLEGSA